MMYVDEGGCFTQLNEDGTITIGLSRLLGATSWTALQAKDITDVKLSPNLSCGERDSGDDPLIELSFSAASAERIGRLPDVHYYGAYAPTTGEIVWINENLSFTKLRAGPNDFLANDLHVARLLPDDVADYHEYIQGSLKYFISEEEMKAGVTLPKGAAHPSSAPQKPANGFWAQLRQRLFG